MGRIANQIAIERREKTGIYVQESDFDNLFEHNMHEDAIKEPMILWARNIGQG